MPAIGRATRMYYEGIQLHDALMRCFVMPAKIEGQGKLYEFTYLTK